MDHMMPEMDGVDATACIRRLPDEAYQKLPIIALSANALVGAREMFIHEGMNDFIAKPIDVTKLVAILKQWLPQSKIIEVSEKDDNKQKDKIELLHIPGVDTKSGIDFVGGSLCNYLEILHIYYEDGKRKCETLHQHLKQQDIDSFRTEIHAVKSTSATIGANDISMIAEKLETAANCGHMMWIKQNAGKFILDYQNLLQQIEQVLLTYQPHQKNTLKAMGDLMWLKSKIKQMNQALMYADIKQIESCLDQMQNYRWNEQILSELNAMKSFLSVFEYDQMLHCLKQIENIIC